MRLVVRARLVVVLAAVAGISTGCGGPKALPPVEAEADHHRSIMEEVGQALQLYKQNNSKPAAKVADLAKYEMGVPQGYAGVKDGSIVDVWSVPLVCGGSEKGSCL